MKILLDEIMNERELSLGELAQITGMAKSTLYDIVRSKHDPRMKTMEHIAKKLNLRITDLFESKYK